MIYGKAGFFILILVLSACQAGPFPAGEANGGPPLRTTTLPNPPLDLAETQEEGPLVATATPNPPPSSLDVSPTLAHTPALTNTLAITAVLPQAPAALLRAALPVTVTWAFTDIQVAPASWASQVAWTLDGGAFGVATAAGVLIYDSTSLQQSATFHLGEAVKSLVFAPPAGDLVLGGLNGDVHWWNPQSGKYLRVWRAHRLGVTALGVSLRGDVLASGSDDATVRVWRGEGRPGLLLPGPTNRITALAVNPDGSSLAAGSFAAVWVWNPLSGELLQTLEGLPGWVEALAFSPDGSQLVVAGEGPRLQVWDTLTWEMRFDFPITGLEALTALAYSPGGTLLAVGGPGGQVLLWDVVAHTLSDPRANGPSPVTSLAFSPNGEYLLVSFESGWVRLWRIQT